MRQVLCIALTLMCMAADEPKADDVFCPPAWAPHTVYAHSFDGAAPQLNAAGLKMGGQLAVDTDGFRGGCARLEQRRELLLSGEGEALSPHRPLTVMFWWALPEELPKQGGFGLIQLPAKRGYISAFARGGPWCGLEEAAGVLQVWSIPGVRDENSIYDRKLGQTVGLKKGQWHHTAMVINGGSQISVYTDGRLVHEMRTQGRSLSIEDGFNQIRLGGGVLLDELLILRTPLEADQIDEYVTAMRQMRRAYR